MVYYLFDVLILDGHNLMGEPLSARRELLQSGILPKLAEPIRYYPPREGQPADLIESVRAYQFEGLVAKRLDSVYEPGLRSGAWLKMRINRGQEFVIGGYTQSPKNIDPVIFGYYDGDTASKMKECRWVKPILVGQFEFAEWTPDIFCGTRVS